MKKKILLISLACTVLLGAVVILSVSAAGKRPFKKLDAAAIASATVRLIPPDKTVPIMEPKELVSLLREVVIYGRDDSYTEYDGQSVIFMLTMTDGTQLEIMAYNPFLVIDGVGYRTKYEPCQALNGYANKLLESMEQGQ